MLQHLQSGLNEQVVFFLRQKIAEPFLDYKIPTLL